MFKAQGSKLNVEKRGKETPMSNNEGPKSAKSFEDLRVYQEARNLTNDGYDATRHPPFSNDFILVNQIRKALISIISNIAEGFERGGNAELIQFLYIAKGSCGEVRAQIRIAYDQGYLNSEDHEALEGQCRHVSNMLSKFITRLKRSGFRGEKYREPTEH